MLMLMLICCEKKNTAERLADLANKFKRTGW
jgi:hypothetical protein